MRSILNGLNFRVFGWPWISRVNRITEWFRVRFRLSDRRLARRYERFWV